MFPNRNKIQVVDADPCLRRYLYIMSWLTIGDRISCYIFCSSSCLSSGQQWWVSCVGTARPWAGVTSCRIEGDACLSLAKVAQINLRRSPSME